MKFSKTTFKIFVQNETMLKCAENGMNCLKTSLIHGQSRIVASLFGLIGIAAVTHTFSALLFNRPIFHGYHGLMGTATASHPPWEALEITGMIFSRAECQGRI